MTFYCLLSFESHVCVLTQLGILTEVFKPQVLGTDCCFTERTCKSSVSIFSIIVRSSEPFYSLKSFEMKFSELTLHVLDRS